MTGSQPGHSIAPTNPRHLRVAVVTPGLRTGGAETFLARLVAAIGKGCRVTVLSLGSERDDLVETVRAAGAEVIALRSSPMSVPHSVTRMVLYLRRDRPDVLQGWMYAGDVAAAMLGTLVIPRTPMAGSIRMTRLPDGAPLRTRLWSRLARMVNRRVAARTIACDPSAAEIHVNRGYPAEKIVVIPNMPPEWARPSSHSGRGRGGATTKIGLAARYEPGKGHVALAEATISLNQRGREVVCSFAGRGCEIDGELQEHISQLAGYESALFDFRGKLTPAEMPGFYETLDVYVMPSVAWEGFPNSLMEACASGVPALATDIGAAQRIVPESHLLADGSADTIAQKLLDLLSTPCDENLRIARANQERLWRDFAPDRVAGAYMETWKRMTAGEDGSKR